jgi:enamine deaminase RidA (YjgF/YER057c/UK114 family)
MPVRIGRGDVYFARGMKAGRWVFTTGNMAQDFRTGLAADVLSEALPYADRPKAEKEAERVFDHIEETLADAGSDLQHVVRLDQYYPSRAAVDPYHVVRRARFKPHIPPSTSMLMERLLLDRAEMDVQTIAALPRSDLEVRHIVDQTLGVHSSSGYSPGVAAGDFVFLAGMIPTPVTGDPARYGLAEAAQPPEHYQWRGEAIELETEYVIRRKILPALEAAGSSAANVVKAQIYLTHVEDFAHFNSVWKAYFPKAPPATTLIPAPKESIGARWARVEINVVALVDSAAAKREVIATDTFTGYDSNSAAIRAADLLMLSGLMAVDRHGLVEQARIDPRQSNLQCSVEAQARYILNTAAHLCDLAGTRLDRLVRAQHFLTDIRDFYTVYRVWNEFLPGWPIPFSAVQVPSPMPVPGATLLMDLWFYAP